MILHKLEISYGETIDHFKESMIGYDGINLAYASVVLDIKL
ncbi:hypothetical protein PMG71_08850 [Roseofilum sp. BLCC_M154]|uniref:Uncharacterized protein n=1 Tax=Roseofilum acuticapitatum BLCC-M154 TaxID=3022444 RepID=A0ABT7ARK1_9CYAN|nr:hypothetical protein [Roseofilum acuticapitatum]MDJ1169531.1 hypothetical protein [Roseofilum acuticapitatum BLCC-M154]